METPSTPKSATPKKLVYAENVETSGDTWTDIHEATKRLSFSDFSRIGEMPCVRSSLLTGIASGVGVGVIRGVSARPFVASNWAVYTFLVISTGSWILCQKAKRDEFARIHRVMDSLPARTLKKGDGMEPQND
ncbi:hypothetical protein BDM02DRAFT_3104620 [Thelephora ganbajun]|uniref:Uncharacterized protein n=1 Tax=Thelephora ganbajun TaxID=370292 RepID=A0ACB6Z0T0_THEGA|nr:hypothetical protein BDM02DRAFT_3104620 [Thelephora ganbajun]